MKNCGMLLLRTWCWEDQSQFLNSLNLIPEWAWWINPIPNLNISNNRMFLNTNNSHNKWLKEMNFSNLNLLMKWFRNHSLRNKRLILLIWDKRESKGNWTNIMRIKLSLQFVINKVDNQIPSKMNRSNKSIVFSYYQTSESWTFGWWEFTKGRTINSYPNWIDL